MIAQRAIFTSDENSDVRGYHLVAKSDNINASLSQRLSVLGPTHGSLESDDPDGSSLNYCLLNDEWAVISRSAYGGPEYSDRGSFRVVTTFMAVPHQGLAGYGQNPLLLAHVAHALGHLTVPFPVLDAIEAVELPNQTLLAAHPPAVDESHFLLAQQLAEALGDGRPIVVCGAGEPSAVMHQLFHIIPSDLRPWLSFSTKLAPSINRPFRVQFSRTADERRVNSFEAKGFFCIQAD